MIPYIASQFSGQFVFFLFPFQFSSVFTDLRSSYTDQWFNCTGVLLSVRTVRIVSTESTCVHTCISSTHFTSFTSLHSSYFFMIRIMESSRVLYVSYAGKTYLRHHRHSNCNRQRNILLPLLVPCLVGQSSIVACLFCALLKLRQKKLKLTFDR